MPLLSRKTGCETFNAACTKKDLAQFWNFFQKKRPQGSDPEWFLYWNDAQSPHHHLCTEVLGGKRRQDNPPTLYLPDITPADFFFFPRVNSKLASFSLSQERFKTSWDGVIHPIDRDVFHPTIQQWIERCKKCIYVCSDKVKK
jgi:hypothetical protein